MIPKIRIEKDITPGVYIATDVKTCYRVRFTGGAYDTTAEDATEAPGLTLTERETEEAQVAAAKARLRLYIATTYPALLCAEGVTMRDILKAIIKEIGEEEGMRVFEWYCRNYHVAAGDIAPATIRREVLGL